MSTETNQTVVENRARADIARAAGLDVFTYDGYTSASLSNCAERQCAGKTHYFSAATRRFHKSTVSKLYAIGGGVALAFIERVGLDFEGTRKGYRVGIVDLTGHMVTRGALDDCVQTLRAAEKLFWSMVNAASADSILHSAIVRERDMALRRAKDMTSVLSTFNKDTV